MLILHVLLTFSSQHTYCKSMVSNVKQKGISCILERYTRPFIETMDMSADNKNCHKHDAEKWAQCQAFQQGIELLGKRWTGVVLYMLLEGPKRFNELLSDVHGISD